MSTEQTFAKQTMSEKCNTESKLKIKVNQGETCVKFNKLEQDKHANVFACLDTGKEIIPQKRICWADEMSD